jgi:hypothetical protein
VTTAPGMVSTKGSTSTVLPESQAPVRYSMWHMVGDRKWVSRSGIAMGERSYERARFATQLVRSLIATIARLAVQLQV